MSALEPQTENYVKIQKLSFNKDAFWMEIHKRNHQASFLSKRHSVALQKIGLHPRQGRDRQKERRLQKQRLEQTGTRQSEHLGGKAPLGPRPQKRQVSHSFFIHKKRNSYITISVTRLILIELFLLPSTIIYIFLNVTINTFFSIKDTIKSGFCLQRIVKQ